ncbi:MAG: transketolase [Betaproteobacteria bacterium]|nr:transketolase [Betaproteobacteria bacterium]
MRNTFAQTFYEAAKQDPRLCVVVADISPAGAMDKLRKEFPERFINTGVAEQIMIGMCAGMALRGLKPFAYTIATFALFRPFEFVRDDLSYQNLPVTVVGIGGGVTYSTLGSTHHAQEDVAIACAIPNLRVLAPCDPAETRAATLWCIAQEEGPVYLRLGKAGEPDLTSGAPDPFRFGKVRFLKRGRDLCVLGYGPTLKLGVQLARSEEERGVSTSVVSVHTLKPLDEAGIAAILESHGRVVVVEEMAPRGGLGDAVKRIAWDRQARCRIECFALRDEFIHLYGKHEELLDVHGISLDRMLQSSRT